MSDTPLSISLTFVVRRADSRVNIRTTVRSDDSQFGSSSGTSTRSSQSIPNISISINLSDGANSGSRATPATLATPATPPMVAAGGNHNRFSEMRSANHDTLVRIPRGVPRNNRSDSISNSAPEAAIGLRSPIRGSLLTDRIWDPSTSHASTSSATTGPTASDAEVSGPSSPNRKRTDPNESLEETYKCPICLESVTGRKPVVTICEHIFCSRCIDTALKHNRKCPMCRGCLIRGQLKPIIM
ncbi:pre-mRNA-splicing factor cwc24-like [Drosophila miranda]|uniref:pre-mRNA-splicing factor cwc24-like n=1 Tax=Drosophila miranda TaxID=7229 RepID=UPI0007E88BCC|nr:pre-mRNA-splicing factor cwc24-like [Drosophila miranda]